MYPCLFIANHQHKLQTLFFYKFISRSVGTQDNTIFISERKRFCKVTYGKLYDKTFAYLQYIYAL